MKMKKYAVFVIAIVALAAFFRLAWIGGTPPGLYPDEAMNGNNGLEAINTGNYKIFYPENNGREGLFINIQALFLKLFLLFTHTPEPWMLRIPSALFGIFTIIGMYFLTKELFHEDPDSPPIENDHSTEKIGIRKYEVALYATFFIATSFWHINFSRIGFRAIMAPAFLVWGIYLLLRAFRKWNEQEKRKSLRNLFIPLLAGAVYGLGMHSYIAYRATPAIILFIFILLWMRSGWKKIALYAGIFCAGAIIVSLPLIFYFSENPGDFLGRTTQVSVFSGTSPVQEIALNSIKTIGMLFVGGDGNWRHNYPGHAELFLPIGIFFIIGIGVGIKKILRTCLNYIREKKQPDETVSAFLILFAWIAVAMLPVVVSNEGIPHALRSILMIPPVFICAGYGAMITYEYLKKILSQTTITWVLWIAATILVAHTYTSYFVLWGNNHNTKAAFTEEYVTIGRAINNIPNETPKYIIVTVGGTDVRGMPMSTQTTMFITDTFTPEKQKEKNVFYVLPEKIGSIPKDALSVTIR